MKCMVTQSAGREWSVEKRMKEVLLITVHSSRKDAEPFLRDGDSVNFDGDLFVTKSSRRVGYYIQEFALERVNDTEDRG